MNIRDDDDEDDDGDGGGDGEENVVFSRLTCSFFKKVKQTPQV